MTDPMAHDLEQEMQAILTKIQKYHPKDDISLVVRAYQFACEAHKDQKRKSGEPYIIHPISVATILANLMLDSTTVAAGFLHDCVEDNKDVSVETIESQFGPEVALLVDGVTKLKRLDFTSKEDQQAESLRKMFLAMAKDIRVVLIKLADRLHNMRTLKFQSPDRQVAIARETLDVYAPLCHRLGMSTLKWEMEDLALRYIDPAGYYDLVEKVGQKRREREHSIQVVISALNEQLTQAGIRCEIAGRPKHFYSIYRKLKTQGKTFDQIYDLIAVRVLVESIPDCYAVLGIVHTMWTQVPNRFKDYISMPKGNMYQSLHTTVVGTSGELRGQTFEVQIRTWDMHRTAEYGIAAHWRYKEGKQVDSLDSKLYWLRQILDWQNETHDPSEFMDALKVDLFSDEVFVFTPKGDIVNLPRGATPVDFAYHIHSAIGNKCIGAKVNGRIVPLDTALETGDFVEVLTSGNSKGPSQDWIKICKTSEAKSKIRAYLRHELRDENLARGKDILEHEAKRQGYSLSQLSKGEYWEAVQKRYSLHSLEDLYVTVGFGGLGAAQIVNRLAEEYRKTNKPAEPAVEVKPQQAAPRQSSAITQHHSNGVIVEGDSDMLVRFARCCNPLPGDDIVGYITRGRGVSIHRSDCPNMSDMRQTPERFIDVKWEGASQKEDNTAYEANIRVIAYDRLGLFADISTMLSQMEISIVSISARIDKSKARNTTCIDLTLSITDTKQLARVIDKLRKRGDILEVFRLTA